MKIANGVHLLVEITNINCLLSQNQDRKPPKAGSITQSSTFPLLHMNLSPHQTCVVRVKRIGLNEA